MAGGFRAWRAVPKFPPLFFFFLALLPRFHDDELQARKILVTIFVGVLRMSKSPPPPPLRPPFFLLLRISQLNPSLVYFLLGFSGSLLSGNSFRTNASALSLGFCASKHYQRSAAAAVTQRTHLRLLLFFIFFLNLFLELCCLSKLLL